MAFGIKLIDVNGDVIDPTCGAWFGHDVFTFQATTTTPLTYSYPALIGDDVWVKVYRHGVAFRSSVTYSWNAGSGILTITPNGASSANPEGGTVFVFRAGKTL